MHIEEMKKLNSSNNRNSSKNSNTSNSLRRALVITQLPYNTDKSKLLERITQMAKEKKLEGIADLRDESDLSGLRIVIELKRDAIPSIVEANLYKKTSLQIHFKGNLISLGKDGKQPMRFTLRSALKDWLDFRFITIRKRSAYELQKKQTHSPYYLSENQAEAILRLPLSSLTSLEEDKLKKEQLLLNIEISKEQTLMKVDEEVYSVIKMEILAIKKKYAIPRQTRISAIEMNRRRFYPSPIEIWPH
ncbi:Dna gyrase/topoisomerase IV, A subunit domain-containing protein [Cardiosporidium cionae]|uniref:Dna gyrase/topoisomerase IV, A subunit domain-containing protein n=1 Tax=Cardiosporidium cionae TaxID=476202 RepID=A0ABQ7J5R8_9APIC|nr:Dna gyrase/topoisomerase IV, A subunit domain-containing protein [Cardiosporidium cionae]|eukprot:KAF8819308.1 Dna gyrase/topoisomerase IV, A subunit domain-containing protein [Cardiosporidium cionae]